MLALVIGRQIGQSDLVVDLTHLFADLAVFLDLCGIDVALRVGHGGKGRALFIHNGKIGAALGVGHIGLGVDLGLFAVEQQEPDGHAADHNDDQQAEQNAPNNLFHLRMPPVFGFFPILCCYLTPELCVLVCKSVNLF